MVHVKFVAADGKTAVKMNESQLATERGSACDVAESVALDCKFTKWHGCDNELPEWTFTMWPDYHINTDIKLWFQIIPPDSINFTISGFLLADDVEPIPTVRADLVRRLQEKYGNRVIRIDSKGRNRTVTVRAAQWPILNAVKPFRIPDTDPAWREDQRLAAMRSRLP
jgi:hypothetical protein